MSAGMHAAALVAVMAGITVLLRALPFIIFRRRVPPFILYLGRVLPPAIIGMLVIYCLKDIQLSASPYGLPELVAGAAVVTLQAWKRNSLLSILGGTAAYMLLLHI